MTDSNMEGCGEAVTGLMLENQRFWGVMWGPPMIPGLDWAPWSDSEGQPVQLLRPPAIDGQGGWFVVRTSSTDDDGWLYGTRFEKLSQARPGGRASKRVNDQVRSRVWRRLDFDQELQTMHHTSLESPLPSISRTLSSTPPIQQQHAHVSGSQILSALTSNIIHKQLPKPSLFRMWQSLLELWNDSARRHKLLKVVPLDPVGLYLATKAHRVSAANVRLKALRAAHTVLAGTYPNPSITGANLNIWGSSDSGKNLGAPYNKSFRSWKAIAPADADIIAKGPVAGFAVPAHQTSGPTASAAAGAAAAGAMVRSSMESGRASIRTGRVAPGAGPGRSMHVLDTLTASSSQPGTCAAAAVSPASPGHHGRYARRAPIGPGTASTLLGRVSAERTTDAPVTLTVEGDRSAATSASSMEQPPRRGGTGASLKPGRTSWRWPWQHSSSLRQSDGRAGNGSTIGAASVSGPSDASSNTKAELQAELGGLVDEGEKPPSLLPDMDNPTALVEELLTIVNYTRAAYGYVMAAGHMANIGTIVHMVGISAWFNPVSGASEEANNQAIHALTGIPQSDILLAMWRNHIFQPCHYLAVDRAHGRLVLSIRGSMELGDICTDLAAAPSPCSFGGGLGACHVHEGLLAAAEFIKTSTKAALTKAAVDYPGWPLLVTGHSLGAGVAALLAIIMRYGHGDNPQPSSWADRVFCVAVAGPPVVSGHVAERCTDFIVTLVNNMDFVPRLSHYSVELMLTEMVRSSPAVQLADNLSNTLAAFAQAMPWNNNNNSNSSGRSGSVKAGGEEGDAGITSARAEVVVVPEGSIDDELAEQVLGGAAALAEQPLEVELITQRNPYTAVQELRRLQRDSTATGEANARATPFGNVSGNTPSPAPERAETAPPAAVAGSYSGNAAGAKPQRTAQDAGQSETVPDQLGAGLWWGDGEGPMFPATSWQGSFFGGWLPYRASDDGGESGSPQSSFTQEPDDTLPATAAPAAQQPQLTCPVAGQVAKAGQPSAEVVRGVADAEKTGVATIQEGDEDGDVSPSDRLLECWSDLVHVVKTETQSAVEAVGDVVGGAVGAAFGDAGSTLGAVAEAGRHLPASELVAHANAAGQRSTSMKSWMTPPSDEADWIQVGPLQPGADGKDANVDVVDAGTRTASAPALAGSKRAGGVGQAASGVQTASGYAPNGPTSHPTTLPEVMQQVVEDLEAVAADKKKARQGESEVGADGLGGDGRAGSSVTELSKEDVAERLAPTKLYLPGRVLWMVLEEQDVVMDILSNQKQQEEGEKQGDRQQQEQQQQMAPSADGNAQTGVSPAPGGDQEPPAWQHLGPEGPHMEVVGTGGLQTDSKNYELLGWDANDDRGVGGRGKSDSLERSCRLLELAIAQDFMPCVVNAGQQSMDNSSVMATAPSKAGVHALEISRQVPKTSSGDKLASHSLWEGAFGSPGGPGVSGPSQGLGPGGKSMSFGQFPAWVPDTPNAEVSDDGSLSQKLSLGFKALKQGIEQVLGQTALLEEPSHDLTAPRDGGAAGGGTASADSSRRGEASATAGISGRGGAKQQLVCLLEADRDMFEELLFVSNCAADHIPDAYHATLKQLHIAIMTGRLVTRNNEAGGPSNSGAQQPSAGGGGGGATTPEKIVPPSAFTHTGIGKGHCSAPMQELGGSVGGQQVTGVGQHQELDSAGHLNPQGGAAPGVSRNAFMDMWRLG